MIGGGGGGGGGAGWTLAANGLLFLTYLFDLGYSFKYHRIDLDPPQHPCLHFGKTVTSGEYN